MNTSNEIFNDIIISGEIEGSYWNEIALRILNEYTENYETYSYMPDSSEYFQFKINLHWPTPFTLSISENQYYGWVFPGDSVYIKGSVHKDNEDFIKGLNIIGRGASKFRYFQRVALNSQHDKIKDRIAAARSLPYLEFLQEMDSIYSLKLQTFKEDTSNLRLSKEFVDYELNRIKYDILERKADEPVLRKALKFDSTQVPVNYYSFLDEVNYKDSSFMNGMYYYRFLESAFGAMIKEEIPAYPIRNRLDIFMYYYFRSSDSLLSGRVKEYFETRAIRNYAKIDVQAFDSMITILDAKGYNSFLLKKHKDLRDSLLNIDISIDDNIQVFTKNKIPVTLKEKLGNAPYTYVSVWYIGCKGCHLDFRNKAEIYSKYKDQIQFINICTDEPSESVENFIAKYGATGFHYFDINHDIVSLLNITAYPVTFLFDGEGNLVKNNFYRPGDPMLEKYFDNITVN